jgi:hypothetical protein
MLGLMSPNKKIAAVIIGGGKSEEKSDDMDLKKEAELDAAKQLLKAFEKKDAQMIVDAFKGMMECCHEAESDSEDKSEGSEE